MPQVMPLSRQGDFRGACELLDQLLAQVGTPMATPAAGPTPTSTPNTASGPIGIIDTHSHLHGPGGATVSGLQQASVVGLDFMKQSGIIKTLIMNPPSHNPPRDLDVDQELAKIVQQYPDSYAFLGGGSTLSPLIIDSASGGQVTADLRRTFEEQAEAIVQMGAAGFGETAALHLSFVESLPYFAIPADTPLFLLLADIAARSDMPIDIHMEAVAEDMPLPKGISSPPNPPTLQENISGLEHLLAHNRNARIVWAHAGWDNTGHRTVALMRRLLETHANLYMNIKLPIGSKRDDLTPPENQPVDDNGRIRPEWIDLLQAFPDRFVLGSEAFYDIQAMARGASAAQTPFIEQLPPDLARKVGYENAARIYRLDDAPVAATTPTPTPSHIPIPTPTPAPEQVDYLVTENSPICPIGGPIFRVSEGRASVVAQGNPLQKPRGGVVDADGKYIVADGLVGLMKVDLETGAVSQIAAGPPFNPRDVKIDARGDYIVADWPNEQNAQFGPPAVYRVSPSGEATVIAQGSPLSGPHSLAIDLDGNYIVGDSLAGVIRVSPQGEMTVVVAAGPTGRVTATADVAVEASGNYIVVDKGRGNLLRVTPAGQVSIIHGGSPFTRETSDTPGGPRGVVVDGEGNYILVDEGAIAIFHVTPGGIVTAIFEGPPFCGPADVNIVSRGALSGAATTPATTPTPTPRPSPTPSPLSQDWPPIVDVHAHWPPEVTVQTMLQNMDEANVLAAVIMPSGGQSFGAALELQKSYPDRFLAFLGFQNDGWTEGKPGFLAGVEEKLQTGQFKGLGEVLLRHYAIPNRDARDTIIDADAPNSLQTLDLAATYKVPVILHMEAEEGTLEKLRSALEQKPVPLVIWGHAGRATADTVDSFLSTFPNLYIDLAALGPVILYGREKNPITDAEGVLTPEWRTLLIKFQDRVFVGSDPPFPDLWNEFTYIDFIQGQRAILRQLPDEVAEKLAFRNAARVFNLEVSE